MAEKTCAPPKNQRSAVDSNQEPVPGAPGRTYSRRAASASRTASPRGIHPPHPDSSDQILSSGLQSPPILLRMGFSLWRAPQVFLRSGTSPRLRFRVPSLPGRRLPPQSFNPSLQEAFGNAQSTDPACILFHVSSDGKPLFLFEPLTTPARPGFFGPRSSQDTPRREAVPSPGSPKQ